MISGHIYVSVDIRLPGKGNSNEGPKGVLTSASSRMSADAYALRIFETSWTASGDENTCRGYGGV